MSALWRGRYAWRTAAKFRRFRPDADLEAGNFDFDGDVLAKAIAATFERRGTSFPSGAPVALSADFSGDRVKQQQWSAFLRRSGLDPSVALEEVVDLIARFIEGLAPAFATGDRLEKTWSPSGGWEPRR